MDLILWRHADADPGGFDLGRTLTPKGHKQAARVAAWLAERLPEKYELLVSPAVRAQETAQALRKQFRTVKSLAPGATPAEVLKAASWPQSEVPAIVVGHQPDLGRTLATLLSGASGDWTVKKGGLWWLASRERDDEAQVVVRAVVTPDLL